MGLNSRWSLTLAPAHCRNLITTAQQSPGDYKLLKAGNMSFFFFFFNHPQWLVPCTWLMTGPQICVEWIINALVSFFKTFANQRNNPQWGEAKHGLRYRTCHREISRYLQAQVNPGTLCSLLNLSLLCRDAFFFRHAFPLTLPKNPSRKSFYPHYFH